ncbi:UDP-N-acetylglucosamine 2-epimerase [Sphingobacterium sp. NGMCC 1.201703]|uniref:UDP-N-acetylglucosamine 2-epimerase n=1 Tax=Sphingobacterium sp. NGMCC 1.201703 TaxID=3388657 RepID=UPI0039FBCA99
MKKICIVTATRAEYGLLKPLMLELRNYSEFKLQVLVTGAHLSPEFGLTYRFLEQDGFSIDEKVEMLLSSDSANGIVKSMGVGMIGYADAFARLSPDAIVILGDRYEMLSVASSAAIFNIPIIHLHGGEITEGAYDDAIRHAISKLSALHFTSTEEYRQRVIQMGEHPDKVYNVGAIGLDNISSLPLMEKEQIEESLGIKFKKYNYQVTFHPETLSNISSQHQFNELLSAIEEQKDSYFIFTKANADTDGRIINQMIDEYVSKNPNKASAYNSLGSLRFLSVVKMCDAIIGNSSSGIIEAPSLHTPTINIGDRQRGRTQAGSILNCDVDKAEILRCFEKVNEPEFKAVVSRILNPYGNGGTAQKIIEVISKVNFKELHTKAFYNIKQI